LHTSLFMEFPLNRTQYNCRLVLEANILLGLGNYAARPNRI